METKYDAIYMMYDMERRRVQYNPHRAPAAVEAASMIWSSSPRTDHVAASPVEGKHR